MGEMALNITTITRGNENTEKKVVPFRKTNNPSPAKANNKKKGQKSEVYAYAIEDLKKMFELFEASGQHLQRLALVLSCNTARRIGDILNLKWENFFFLDGKMRTDILAIEEDKTDKLASPKINKIVKSEIERYIAITGCDVGENNYQNPVFLQLSGTHKGSVLSESGHLKALKRAAKKIGIEYNVGTHSGRKFFGAMNRQLHPTDYESMEILQSIYNHSSTQITKCYIGLTKKKIDKYYDDMGDFFDLYVLGDGEYVNSSENKTVVALDVNDLRDIVSAAYKAGRDNVGNTDAMAHVDAINTLMSMIDSLSIQ